MTDAKRKNTIVILLSACGALVAAGALVMSPRDSSDAPISDTQTSAPVTLAFDDTRFMIPVSGTQPSKGPEDALVTVVFWCHLRSEPCAATDSIIERTLKEHEGKVRWVYRHALNRERPDSKLVHGFAQATHRMGEKFWEARALIQQEPAELIEPGQLLAITEALELDGNSIAGALQTGAFDRHLSADMHLGEAFGATSVPAVYVNGRPLGDVPADRIGEAVDRLIALELANAEALVARGIEPSNVYASLTKNAKWSVDDDPQKRAEAAVSAPTQPSGPQ